MSKKLRPATLKTKSNGDAIVSGSEFLQSVGFTSSSAAAGALANSICVCFDPAEVAIKPCSADSSTTQSSDLQTLNTRIAYLAAGWEKYRVRRLEFEYVPTCGATSSGSLVLSFDTDPMDAISYSTTGPPPLSELVLREHAVVFNVYEGVRMRAPIDPAFHYYVNMPNSTNTAQAYTLSQGRFASAGYADLNVVGAPATQSGSALSAAGVLLLHYELEFMNPTLPTLLTSDATETIALELGGNGNNPTLIPASSSSGAVQLRPASSADTVSPFSILYKYSTEQTFNPVQWWNYTSNTFSESGLYSVLLRYFAGGSNGSQVTVPSAGLRLNLNNTPTYSDTPSGAPATPTAGYGTIANPAYGANTYGTQIGSPGTSSTGTSNTQAFGYLNIARNFLFNAGNALTSLYITANLVSVTLGAAISTWPYAVECIVSKIAGVGTPLYERHLALFGADGGYEWQDFVDAYTGIVLDDGTDVCNVCRVIDSGDERFAHIEGYRELLREAALSDRELQFPRPSAAISLYNEWVSTPVPNTSNFSVVQQEPSRLRRAIEALRFAAPSTSTAKPPTPR